MKQLFKHFIFYLHILYFIYIKKYKNNNEDWIFTGCV